MKKNILGIGLIMVIGLVACAQQKKAATKGTAVSNTKNEQTTIKTATSAAAAAEAGKINSLSMTRGACFGKCPSYTVELFTDGRAIYKSHMFTKYEGTFEKNIGAAKVQALFKQFEANRADTCGTYKSMIPDLPPLHYSIQFEQKKVDIRNANFGPKFLVELSKKVDALAAVDDSWKKTAEPEKPKQ